MMDNIGKRALFVSYNAAGEQVVESQVLPYLAGLVRAGVDMTMLTFEKSRACHDGTRRKMEGLGIGWVRLAFHSRPVILAKAVDIISGAFAVSSLVLKKKPGIVHSRGVIAAAMSIVPARLAGAYFIFDMKSSLAEAYRLSGKIGEGSLYYRVIAWLEDVCIRNADAVIVETRIHKAALEDRLKESIRKPHIVALPCCVDLGRFEPAVASRGARGGAGPMRIVYLGSLSGWYMLDEMLDFFKALKTERPDAEFVFLTDDKDGQISSRAEAKGLTGISVDKVGYGEVPARLSRATAGILFKWPNRRLDSFPIKIGEYLASGLPVVVNHGMGDVEELIDGNGVGVVVDSLDTAGYEKAAEKLRGLLSGGGDLPQKCRDTVSRNLSSSSALAQYISVYKHSRSRHE